MVSAQLQSIFRCLKAFLHWYKSAVFIFFSPEDIMSMISQNNFTYGRLRLQQTFLFCVSSNTNVEIPKFLESVYWETEMLRDCMLVNLTIVAYDCCPFHCHMLPSKPFNCRLLQTGVSAFHNICCSDFFGMHCKLKIYNEYIYKKH